MNNKKQISSIEKNVMAQIKTGQARMHPKVYFSIFNTIGVLMVLLFSFVNASIVSLVVLWLRIQGAQGPAYGAKRNLNSMVDSFPWWALLVGVVSLIAAVYFIRKVGNLYKMRLINLVLIIIAVSMVLGFALSYSSLPSFFNRHTPASMIYMHK